MNYFFYELFYFTFYEVTNSQNYVNKMFAATLRMQ